MRSQRISYRQAAYEYDTADDPSLDGDDDGEADDGDDWNGYGNGFETID